jgi:hypothetical protein
MRSTVILVVKEYCQTEGTPTGRLLQKSSKCMGYRNEFLSAFVFYYVNTSKSFLGVVTSCRFAPSFNLSKSFVKPFDRDGH